MIELTVSVQPVLQPLSSISTAAVYLKEHFQSVALRKATDSWSYRVATLKK